MTGARECGWQLTGTKITWPDKEWTRMSWGWMGHVMTKEDILVWKMIGKIWGVWIWGWFYYIVLVYIDDIVVYSKTFKQHLQHLNSVLGAITQANITLSPPKCHIGYQSLILLGQRVSCLGISTHQEKIDAVDTMKPPTKVKELQMFLGFVNYFANYIPFYTWITKPLYRLLSKDTTWTWGPLHQEAFDLCKIALKSTPILMQPMDGRGYQLYMDTSDFGIGTALQQIQPIRIKDLKGTQLDNRLQKAYRNGDPPPQLVTITDKEEVRPVTETWHEDFDKTEVYIERVIAYWSWLLKLAKKNYTPTEKEALALWDALVKFQPIIEGEELTAITDHSALVWAKTHQGANWQLRTWGLTYSAYPKLKIVHRAGRVHSNVDPLSRLERRIPFYDQPATNNPDINLSQEWDIDFYGRMKRKFESRASSLFIQLESPNNSQHEINFPLEYSSRPVTYSASTRIETLLHADLKEIHAILDDYEEDPHFKEVLSSFPKEPPFIFKNYHQNQDRLIFFGDKSRRDCLCVPLAMRTRLIEEIHNSLTGTAHGGFEQTYRKITNGFYWPRMTRDIWQVISTCPICQKIKHAQHLPYGLLQPIPIPTQPFEVVTMDFIGELPRSQGYNSIFVLICKLTK